MLWIRFGAAFMFLTVCLGAFGGHALKKVLSSDMLAIFEVGVRYQAYHALALIGLGLFRLKFPGTPWAGWAFTSGIIIFSGSLYILTLTGQRAWGMVTPVGGLLFILGWGLFLWEALRTQSPV